MGEEYHKNKLECIKTRWNKLLSFPGTFSYGTQTQGFLWPWLKFLEPLTSDVAAPIQIHVLLQQSPHVEDNPSGFSFPLCSFKEQEISSNIIFQLVGNQIKFFAEYTWSQNIINVVESSWASAKGSFLAKPDANGILHMIILIVNSKIS